jgi:hypothetical protein
VYLLFSDLRACLWDDVYERDGLYMSRKGIVSIDSIAGSIEPRLPGLDLSVSWLLSLILRLT